jgi:hypothetical protein
METPKQFTTGFLEGDYAKYPESIREAFPRLAGEVCDLRVYWATYSRLFMEKIEFADAMEKGLGEMLRVFQALLEENMFLSISRLTEKDSRAQANLSLWSLLAAIPSAKESSFGDKVTDSLKQICAAAASVRHHRHKRIAHFDLSVSLGSSILPVVVYGELLAVLEQIEGFLNVFCWEFGGTTIFFDTLSAYQIMGEAEVTIYKAHAYDILESKGVIPLDEWRRTAETGLCT